MGDPYVTVVVCTRNRPLQLEHCLDSLKLQSHPRFDILVVDSASMPPVRELCRRYGVRYVYEPVAGTNRARNIGAQLARGDVIAYIDDDAIAEADWLAMLVREFAEPVVAAVCGKYRYMKIYGDPAALDGDESTEGIVARPRGTFTRQTRDWFATCLDLR